MCGVIKREGLAAALDSLMDGYYRSYTLSTPTRSCLSEINKILYWRGGELPIFDVTAADLHLHSTTTTILSKVIYL
jgi:hypothetical protein